MRPVADHQYGTGEPPLHPMFDQPDTPDPSGDQQSERARRERQRDVSPGKLELEYVTEDGYDSEEPERSLNDPFVLLGSVADYSFVVGVAQGQGDHPADDECSRDQRVGHARGRACSRHAIDNRVELAETQELCAHRGPDNDQQVSHNQSTQDSTHPLPMRRSALRPERWERHVRARPASLFPTAGRCDKRSSTWPTLAIGCGI